MRRHPGPRGAAAARQSGSGLAAIDNDRLAVLKHALESLEERERLLVRLSQDHRRAGARLEASLSVPVPTTTEAGRRSDLREDMGALSDAVSDGIEVRLSDLEAERQDLLCRMSEEGMREGLWIRNPLNRKNGIALQGRGASRKLWEAPWRAAKAAPEILPPREVLGCSRFARDTLLFDLKVLLCCLLVASLSLAGLRALAEAPPETALGFFVAEYVFPFAAFAAVCVLIIAGLVAFPRTLYRFYRPGGFMRRRDRYYSKSANVPPARGNPSVRGDLRGGDIVLNDDNE